MSTVIMSTVTLKNQNFLQRLFEGTVQYDYDKRIDDYNWYLLFTVQLIFYFILNAVLRKVVPPPGDIKDFKEKKKMK